MFPSPPKNRDSDAKGVRQAAGRRCLELSVPAEQPLPPTRVRGKLASPPQSPLSPQDEGGMRRRAGS